MLAAQTLVAQRQQLNAANRLVRGHFFLTPQHGGAAAPRRFARRADGQR